MAGRIKDFLQTGTIDEAEVLRTDERFRTMDHFNKVFGKSSGFPRREFVYLLYA